MAASTILVIDEDLASRNYVAAALQQKGHRVLQAPSGREGLIFAWRDRPDIVVIDPHLTDLPGEELAGRLRADPRTASVPLVGFGRQTDPAGIARLREAGFRDYFVKGPQGLAALLGALALIVHSQQHEAREGGLLIAFLSAKGGTGTSSLCANIARHIGEQAPGAHVAVADLVLPIGSIAGMAGYHGDQNLTTLAALPAEATGPDFLLRRLARLDDWQFHLLAGSPDPQSGNDLDVERIAELVDGLQAAYDFVLLDLGRSLSRISLPLIEQADLVVMIVGADMSTVGLTRILWDYLQARGVQPGAVFPILNRAVGLEGLTKAEIEERLGIPVKTSIPYLGGNFSMANNQHQPYALKFPGETATIALHDTARMIIEAARRSRIG